MDIAEIASEMMTLFKGYQNAYGTYTIQDKYSLKKKGRGITIKSPVTLKLWIQHLEGTLNSGIGIVPINEEAQCNWGCIDIDSYQNFDPHKLAKEVSATPLVICRSKSGGAHCFLFTQDAVPAGLMQLKLREIASALGYAGSEIFPKQVQRVSEGDIGNWLNMPYFNYKDTIRYGIDDKGNKLSLEEFLEYAKSKQIKSAPAVEDVGAQVNVDEEFDKLFADGPPCHEAMYKRGIRESEDGRNNCLWSIAQQFLRQAPDTWEQLLLTFNTKHCAPPLPTPEVMQIINSVKKGNGFYKCNDTCCSANCDKELCLSRKFGIGDKTRLMPKFTGIQKTGGIKDCIWYLTLDTNETVELTTEELMSPAKTRMRLVECLSNPLLLPEIKAEEWRKILAKLMDNAYTVIDDITTNDDVLYDAIEEFCIQQRTGKVMADVLQGKPVPTAHGTYFRISDLMKYLEDKKVTRVPTQQLAAKLRMRPQVEISDSGKRIVSQVPFCKYFRSKPIQINGVTKSVNLWRAPVLDGRTALNELPPALLDESPFDYIEEINLE